MSTYDGEKTRLRFWRIYSCGTCGGLVTAWSPKDNAPVREVFPAAKEVHGDIPGKVHGYLKSAIDCLHSPPASVVMAASAVDAMLKEHGYKEGGLFARIKAAAEAGLLTNDMAEWAHEVRLDGNQERHADTDAELPTEDDAKRAIDYATALGQYLFVLPAAVERGRAKRENVG